MLLSLIKSLVRALAVLLLVSFATFSLMFSNGTGIARSVLGLTATDEQVQAEVARLGLDRPLVVQYIDWLSGAVRGDLGSSYLTGQSVTEALSSRVPVTLSLILITLLITTVISVLLGVTAALYGGWIDRLVQFISVLGAAVPPFIVAIGLVFAFAIAVPYFPATGYIKATDSVQGWIWALTLPVLALIVGSVANAAAQFRGAVADTLSRDFVRTLRARGIPESQLVFRHVLRNAAGPGLVALGLLTLGLFGGTLFIEEVFALPGVGQLANLSAQAGDVPMVMGTVIFVIVLVLVVNFLTDLLSAALNPKARIR
ncbi:ABC transporter permease [Rathayibacter festucae]|uniref:ABC transporter permease subunit n=1 Tax=Rathayibacter festucae TaxID=110937 RepID=A0ABX6GZ73_9MICO|nr:ABC transporter permease [Rathayibacter festucae]MCJ1701813.1 ABC transporter permease [Rathayibacter festucae]QHC62824.1 ABC transporter permease subunit [Rathayibacter festucae]